ncbi:hypothetical protein [Estrella lausannensis]|uniref:Uncharacterized protein n=1 Tax=Estrella lausannensis TaxID=483423 RepID=A0A0H5E679_9BACT|nr:hypothetical protein [Estrella lausannensis]CRX38775.1 hypothetical protein ELAC_1439 [Estrella lausannensis]
MINLNTSIEHYFHNNDHFFYPKLVKTLHEAIENPEKELILSDDILKDESDQIGLLFYLIDRIRIFALKIWNNIRYFFSASYRKNFDAAAKRISEAYNKKMQRIADVTQELTRSRLNLKETTLHKAAAKSRILELKARISSIQEKIDARQAEKDQIVDKAKDLISIKIEQAKPRSYMSRFLSFIYTPTPEPIRPEVQEIAEMDPDFPIDTVDDTFLGSYEREECETTFLQSIRELRRDKRSAESELLKTEERLESESAKVQVAFNRVMDLLKKIETECFENYFSVEDLEPPLKEPDNTETTLRTEPETISPYQSLMQNIITAIREKTNCQELSILYPALLNRLPQGSIEEFRVGDDGEFTIKLRKQQGFWQPSKSITGGAVIVLGDAVKGEIRGRFKEKKILFESGMHFFVKQSLLGYILTKTEGIDFQSRIEVKIGGTYMGQTLWKGKTFKKLRFSWENKGETVPEDYLGGYESFLRNKVDNKSA